MLFLLLCIGHIFLMLYPVNVNGGFVQNNDSNRIQILEGDWQVESVSQFLTKSNDFEDEQQRKTSEPLSQLQDTDLAQLETFDYFVKIYEVRSMEIYDQFLNVVPYAVFTTTITFVVLCLPNLLAVVVLVGFLVYFILGSLFFFAMAYYAHGHTH